MKKRVSPYDLSTRNGLTERPAMKFTRLCNEIGRLETEIAKLREALGRTLESLRGEYDGFCDFDAIYAEEIRLSKGEEDEE